MKKNENIKCPYCDYKYNIIISSLIMQNIFTKCVECDNCKEKFEVEKEIVEYYETKK